MPIPPREAAPARTTRSAMETLLPCVKEIEDRCTQSLDRAREVVRQAEAQRIAVQRSIHNDVASRELDESPLPGLAQTQTPPVSPDSSSSWAGLVRRVWRRLSRSPTPPPVPDGVGRAESSPLRTTSVSASATPRKCVRFASPDKLECVTPTKRVRYE